MTHWGITRDQLRETLEELRSEDTTIEPPRRTKAYLPIGMLIGLVGFVFTAFGAQQPDPDLSFQENAFGIVLAACGFAVFQYGMMRQKGRKRALALTLVLLTLGAILLFFWLCYVSLS